MGKAHPRIRAMLQRLGHTAAKAAEIILEARRGNRFALSWIRIARRGARNAL